MICREKAVLKMPRNQGIDMRRYLITTLFVATLGLAWAPPVLAQGYKTAVGWSGGVFLPTSLNNGAVGGDLVDLKPDLTWIMSGHYDHWLSGGNLGIRARLGLSKPVLPWVQGERDIRMYMVDVGLLLRPVAPAPGKTILPFLAAGVGVVNWGLGDGPSTTFNPAAAIYAGEQTFHPAVSGGIGFDFITPWQWGEGPLVIRVEGRDHIQFASPFDPVNSDDGDFGLIHNAAVVLGFHTGVGTPGG